MGHKRSSHKSNAALCRKAQVALAKAAAEGVKPPTWARAAKVHLCVLSRVGTLLVVPVADVLQLPTSEPQAVLSAAGDASNPSVADSTDGDDDQHSSLALCPAYEPATGEPPKCARGHSCPYVHASLRASSEFTPHVLAMAERGAYDRATVAAPVPVKPGRGESAASELVRAPQLLQTAALARAHHRELVHCSHFRSKGRCDRGDACLFVHAVHESATPTETPSDSTSPSSQTHAVALAAEEEGAGVVPSDLGGSSTFYRAAADVACSHAERRRQMHPDSSLRRRRRRVHLPYAAVPITPSAAAVPLGAPTTAAPSAAAAVAGPHTKYRYDPYGNRAHVCRIVLAERLPSSSLGVAHISF